DHAAAGSANAFEPAGAVASPANDASESPGCSRSPGGSHAVTITGTARTIVMQSAEISTVAGRVGAENVPHPVSIATESVPAGSAPADGIVRVPTVSPGGSWTEVSSGTSSRA